MAAVGEQTTGRRDESREDCCLNIRTRGACCAPELRGFSEASSTRKAGSGAAVVSAPAAGEAEMHLIALLGVLDSGRPVSWREEGKKET